MPCCTVSSLTLVQNLHHISNANYMSSWYNISKPLHSFLSTVFAVHVEYNRWQTTSVSNPLPIYTITVTPWMSYFNLPSHIQIATRLSVSPVSTSFFCDLYRSGPLRLSNAFCQSMKQINNFTSVSTISCVITLSILLLF